jgi:hypothetical protein
MDICNVRSKCTSQQNGKYLSQARVRVRPATSKVRRGAGRRHKWTRLLLEPACAAIVACPRVRETECVRLANPDAVRRPRRQAAANVIAGHVDIRREVRPHVAPRVVVDAQERHGADPWNSTSPRTLKTLEKARAAFVVGPSCGIAARGGNAVRHARIRTRVAGLPNVATSEIDTAERVDTRVESLMRAAAYRSGRVGEFPQRRSRPITRRHSCGESAGGSSKRGGTKDGHSGEDLVQKDDGLVRSVA